MIPVLFYLCHQINPNRPQSVNSPLRVARSVATIESVEKRVHKHRETIFPYSLSRLSHQIELIGDIMDSEKMSPR
jgi:hypothetical protein